MRKTLLLAAFLVALLLTGGTALLGLYAVYDMLRAGELGHAVVMFFVALFLSLVQGGALHTVMELMDKEADKFIRSVVDRPDAQD